MQACAGAVGEDDEDEEGVKEEMAAAAAELAAAAVAAAGLPFEDKVKLVAAVPPRSAAALMGQPPTIRSCYLTVDVMNGPAPIIRNMRPLLYSI